MALDVFSSFFAPFDGTSARLRPGKTILFEALSAGDPIVEVYSEFGILDLNLIEIANFLLGRPEFAYDCRTFYNLSSVFNFLKGFNLFDEFLRNDSKFSPSSSCLP